MPHSTGTSKGQTTIPGSVREALNIRPGDKIEYVVDGNHATIRVAQGTVALAGALESNKGRGMSFDQIREAAARVSARRGKRG